MEVDNEHVSVWSIFPDNVWEQILDSIDDSEDIQNMLIAYPELSMHFHHRKPGWLFGQVFPHLVSKFNTEEKPSFIGLCRQTCKRWYSATHNFIQNHPSRRPYNQDGINRRTVPYREFSFENWNMFAVGQIIKLSTIEEILNFHLALTQLPNPRNPLNTFHIQIYNRNRNAPEETLNAILALFKSFGAYIWDLHLVLPRLPTEYSKPATKTLRKIFKLLSYLPNIRQLYLSFNLSVRYCLNDTPNLWKHLHKLPHLETWHLRNSCPRFFDRHFSKLVATQLRKLVIDSTYQGERFWLDLKNLVELEIRFENERFNADKIQAAMKYFSHLKKLTLANGRPRINLTTCQLFGILANTQLEELDLFSCRIFSGCNSLLDDKSVDKFPSVKYLRLTDHIDQNLDFLRSFPSLEQLDVHYAESYLMHYYYRHNLPPGLDQTLTRTIRDYLYHDILPASVNIWDKIPSLKVLTTISQTETEVIKFVRECGNKRFHTYLETPHEDDNESGENDDVDAMSDANNDDEDMEIL